MPASTCFAGWVSAPFIPWTRQASTTATSRSVTGSSLTLFGNIDITWPLVQGTPADVERDVRDHMDALKPGGRWVAGSSHSIVNYIPHENFTAMIDAIHKYGGY